MTRLVSHLLVDILTKDDFSLVEDETIMRNALADTLRSERHKVATVKRLLRKPARLKSKGMAKYLHRSCPRCNSYVGIVLGEPGRNTPLQAVNGKCLACSYRLAWIVI
jgi:hypothetical protein